MKKSHMSKLHELARKHIFASVENDGKKEKENVYLFGPAGMIVLK